MCGIAGFFGPASPEVLAELLVGLRHRGPDGEGTFVDKATGISLGHRRLAIRDVEGGTQPMLTDHGRQVLVYNGEIYNDDELRHDLKSRGYTFRTKSDTEVVLVALREWGLGALGQLDGQFALCFVDLDERTAILARDRFGEKPLYWSKSAPGLVFASESNVIAKHPWFNPELDEENCMRYLLLGYLPPPFSILSGVRQVIPGCAIRVNFNQEVTAEEVQFAEPWSIPCREAESKQSHSIDIGNVRDAVRSRRVSDVEVGLLLSGGVDSSIIAAAASADGWRPTTFTIGFDNPTFNESKTAQKVAAELGLPNHTRVLSEWTSDRIVPILQSLDEPIADSSYIATYEAFNLASDHTKVVLTGDGADEFFFGYEPYRASALAERLRRIVPSKLLRALQPLIARVPRSSNYMNRIDVIERFCDGLKLEPVTRLVVWMATLRTSEWSRFFREPLAKESLAPFQTESSTPESERLRRYFLSQYLPGSIFSKSDTSAMANGVEARTVFLMPEIVAYALARTRQQEQSMWRGKHSLRRVADSVGLNDVAKAKKHGFATPLQEILNVLGSDPPNAGLNSVNQAAVDEEWSKLSSGRPVRVHFLWALVALVHCRAFREVRRRSLQ